MRLSPSPTLSLIARAKQLRAAGEDIISFAAGEPDFDTPDRIKHAAERALRAGVTKYMPAAGDPDARAAVAEKLTRENAIPDVSPEHVVLTAGGKHALYLILQALLDPPDADQPPAEVLLPTPGWVSYAPQTTLAGGRVVEIPAQPQHDFKISPVQLRQAITPRSRVFIFNSPSNPCGVTYSPDEVRALAETLQQSLSTAPDLVVITDEIYEKLLYDGQRHLSMGSLPALAERTITVNGLSKAYSMTGWRVGYLAGSGDFGRELAAACAKLQSQMNTSVTSFCHPVVRTALTECADEVDRMRQAFEQRGRLLYERLLSLSDITCPKPTGAFYAFPDVSAHFGKTSPAGSAIKTADDFARALLDEQKVAAVPGEGFLGAGARCVRFSFACAEDDINRGLDRVAAFLARLW